MARTGTVKLSIASTYDSRGTDQAERSLKKFREKFGAAEDSMAAKMAESSVKLDQHAAKWGKIGDAFQDVGGKMKATGATLTASVTAPIVALGAMAVNTAAEFETSMNMVQASSGASGDELSKLGELAKQMGADTIYSANESATAMLELSKSGISPAAISAGALEATMQLAAAGGIELADAAIVTANAMNTFGLEAGDAASIANALAGGANESSASVEDLQQALSQVGPGAINAGLSLQETVGVLAAFADNGIKGSDAGTSLKTMLQRLVPQTESAALAMEELGLEFINADGSFKDIDQIAQQLQDSLGGLSEAERAAALQRIFGSDATRAATVLMKEGAEGLARYTTATNNQTAASEMAEARMSGTAGAIERMRGSIETAALAVGESLAPIIADLADDIGALADKFGALDKEQQENILKWVAVAAAAGPVLLITGQLVTTIGGAIKVYSAFSGVLAAYKAKQAAATAATVASNTAIGATSGLSMGAQAGMVAMAGVAGYAIGNLAIEVLGLEDELESLGKKIGESDWFMKAFGGTIAQTSDLTADQIALDKELGLERDENNTLTEESIAKLRAYNATQRDGTTSTNNAAIALAAYRDELNQVKNEQQGAEAADIAYERAKIRLTEAQERYTAVVDKFGPSSDEAKEAALDLRDAELNLETSADRAKQAQQELTDAINKMPRPSSPAGWVAYYQAIGDKASYAAAKANLATGALAKGGGGTRQLVKYGTGGYVDQPHIAIVGDEPEYIINPKAPNAMDLLAGLTADMGLGGSAVPAPVTSTVSNSRSISIAPGAVVIHADGGGDAYSIAAAVESALQRVVRSASLMGA